MALARVVLPQPGGPYNSIERGSFTYDDNDDDNDDDDDDDNDDDDDDDDDDKVPAAEENSLRYIKGNLNTEVTISFATLIPPIS
jgi:hypothetical protein